MLIIGAVCAVLCGLTPLSISASFWLFVALRFASVSDLQNAKKSPRNFLFGSSVPCFVFFSCVFAIEVTSNMQGFVSAPTLPLTGAIIEDWAAMEEKVLYFLLFKGGVT